MRSSLFWDVTQHGLVVTKVLGQPISPIFKCLSVQEVRREHLGTKLYREWCGQRLVDMESDASQKG